MSVQAANDRQVEHSGQAQIVDVGGPTGDQPGILFSADTGTDIPVERYTCLSLTPSPSIPDGPGSSPTLLSRLSSMHNPHQCGCSRHHNYGIKADYWEGEDDRVELSGSARLTQAEHSDPQSGRGTTSAERASAAGAARERESRWNGSAGGLNRPRDQQWLRTKKNEPRKVRSSSFLTCRGTGDRSG
jgi:hypothetical protein